MTNLNGDNITAAMIQLNTAEKKLWLKQPDGILYLRKENQPIQSLKISSRDLFWDDKQQTMLLQGGVKINQDDALVLSTNKEIVLSQALMNGKKTLRSILSPEHTYVSYVDMKKGDTHKIYCPGPFSINNETREMRMQGAVQTAGETNGNGQVYIDDVLGEMFADTVYIYYQWLEQKISPEKVVLDGSVRLINRFDGHMEESGSVLHHALADRVEFFPLKNEMVVTSQGENRVLLIDKVNNVQMSAPTLNVKYDPATKKESIQGLGDVRFTFIEEELSKIKRQFPSAEKKGKESKGAKQRKQ